MSNNPKITSVSVDSLILVSFAQGIESPKFTVSNIEFDSDNEKFSEVAILKACAKLFLDEAEILETKFTTIVKV